MKKNNNILYIILFVFFILLLIIILYFVKRIDSIEIPLMQQKEQEQKTIQQIKNNTEQIKQEPPQINRSDRIIYDTPNQPAYVRDRQVIYDQLYPPLNRTDRITFDTVAYETNQRNINIPTNINAMNDSYRMVGYIVTTDENKKDIGGGTWKVMGKNKNRNQSEFYLVPTDRNSEVKIPITDDIVVGTKIRDIYNIPNNINFNSPFLSSTPYQFVELPKTDWQGDYN